MRTLSFCVREAATGLWRQRGSTALSVLTIAIAMTVLGTFLAATDNLNRAIAAWGAAAEFTVYLRDDVTAEQRSELNRLLAESHLVVSRTYVSKADARRRFSRDFPDLAPSVAALEENPLPASIDVRLKPGSSTTEAVESLATRTRVAAGVADVRYDRRWLARLSSAVSAVGWTGWILGGVLVLAAALTVATVVRLSLHARRHEVDLMQLMGAPVGLLRGPLVVEGVLHGGLGATVAIVAVYGAHAALRERLGATFPGILESGFVAYLPWTTALGLVLGGMVVGCLGGVAASRHVR
jgi:cell division transport system permease protein